MNIFIIHHAVCDVTGKRLIRKSVVDFVKTCGLRSGLNLTAGRYIVPRGREVIAFSSPVPSQASLTFFQLSPTSLPPSLVLKKSPVCNALSCWWWITGCRLRPMIPPRVPICVRIFWHWTTFNRGRFLAPTLTAGWCETSIVPLLTLWTALVRSGGPWYCSYQGVVHLLVFASISHHRIQGMLLVKKCSDTNAMWGICDGYGPRLICFSNVGPFIIKSTVGLA